MSETEQVPFHLQGNFAPVLEEITVADVPVTGALPPALRGRYVRNGPNPKSGESPHWFVGDGMLHGVELRDGQARWYRNRWVRTRAFLEAAEWLGPDGVPDLTVGRANTHVVCHAGRILALVESSYPTEVTPTLDTVGCYDFGGRLRTAMTAHPKICPVTGELHFFAYSHMPPFLTYHRADRNGALVQSEAVEVPAPTMVHDFAITRGHVIFMDLPVVFDLELVQAGRLPYRWSDTYGARVGVMPRAGSTRDVRWLAVEPCYVFHSLNAFEDGDGIVMDVVRYPELWRESASTFAAARLYRWRIDLVAGRVREQALDDRAVEFPRCDERRTGLANRYGYAVDTAGGADDQTGTALVKYDLERGTSERHDFGAGRIPGEPVFVPTPGGRSEDDGWVLSYVYDAARDASDLVLLEASRFAAAPAATVRLPRRIPFGFHGSWIPDVGGAWAP
jgi:carotenoid cleavage dioxygenase